MWFSLCLSVIPLRSVSCVFTIKIGLDWIGAYRKPPSLFWMVPSQTPYDLPFPQNGIPRCRLLPDYFDPCYSSLATSPSRSHTTLTGFRQYLLIPLFHKSPTDWQHETVVGLVVTVILLLLLCFLLKSYSLLRFQCIGVYLNILPSSSTPVDPQVWRLFIVSFLFIIYRFNPLTPTVTIWVQL